MDNTKTRLQNLDEEKYMEIIKEELLKHKDIKYKEFLQLPFPIRILFLTLPYDVDKRLHT